VKGQAEMPRKKIDGLVEFAKGYGVKGLAYLAVLGDGSFKSSFAKFMTEEELKRLVEAMGGEPGDLLLFAADRLKLVWCWGPCVWSLQSSLDCWMTMYIISSG
jgi:aspartyl-tRNA synthetase